METALCFDVLPRLAKVHLSLSSKLTQSQQIIDKDRYTICGMMNVADIPIKFGKRVRELRRLKGLSQEDLEDLCGLDRTYISSLERGHRNVSLKNIVLLAVSLGVTPSQLLEGIDIRIPNEE